MASLELRLRQAFERRMGKSVMPLEVTEMGPGRHLVRDPETGSWAEYDTSWWRIRRVAEHEVRT